MENVMLSLRTALALTPLLLALACAQDDRSLDLVDASGGASQGDGGEGEGDGDENGEDGGDDDGGGGDDGQDDGGIKYDVGSGTGGPGDESCDPEVDPDCACTMVDILFVVDNSLSMATHQQALAAAFPDFVAAMFTSLPPQTNLHVGVTTTEFLFQPSGGNSNIQDGACILEPQDLSLEDVYVTPDQQNTGVDGAQGRLRVIDGRSFYDIDTDAAAADCQAFADWFGRAVVAGETGSNIEMSSGAAAWAGEPANEGTNAGFLRDAGAVYVIVFIQDEFDQTPVDAQNLLAMIAGQKSACGGLDCVVGGGWFNASCSNVNGYQNLPQLIDGFSDSFQRSLAGGGIDGSDLSQVLTGIIAEKCDEIPPVG